MITKEQVRSIFEEKASIIPCNIEDIEVLFPSEIREVLKDILYILGWDSYEDQVEESRLEFVGMKEARGSRNYEKFNEESDDDKLGKLKLINTITLSEEDAERFLKGLDKEREPNQKLKDAATRHNKIILS